MLVSPLPLSFLDTYSLWTSFLRCNALCMVISFLVLWYICLSSFLVDFMNGLEYLTRGTDQVFIPLIPFLPYSFVSNSFLVLLRYSFLIFFFHLHLFDSIIIICMFCPLEHFLFFNDLLPSTLKNLCTEYIHYLYNVYIQIKLKNLCTEYIHYLYNIYIQIKFCIVIHPIVPQIPSYIFFFSLFLKSSNLIIFSPLLPFLIWLGYLFQKYI